MEVSHKYNTFIQLANEDFQHFSRLPMAVYLTAPDGVIIDFNQEAASILDLQPADKYHKNITGFYSDPRQRRRILDKLEALPSGEWLKNETIEFKIGVNEKRISLRFFTKEYHSTQNQPAGFISLAFKITEMERFRELEDVMPIGMFEVDSFQNISYANKEFCKILGCSDPKNIIGKPASDFFQNQEDFEVIFEKVKKEEIKKEKLTLKAKNQSWIRGSVSIVPILDGAPEKLWASKGILTDITYDEILKKLPVALFMITSDKYGNEVIARANDAFAKFHGFKSEKECEGMKAADLYPDQDEYQKELRFIKSELQNKRPVLNHFIKTVNYQGEEKEIILNVREIRDESGNIEGRVGAIFDITGDLNRKLMELRHDFGGFLHTYSAVMLNFSSISNAVIRSHGDKVTDKRNKIDVKKAFHEISGQINGLETNLEKFYQKNAEIKAMPDYEIERLKKWFYQLRKKEQEPEKLRASWVRAHAIEIRNLVKLYSKSGFPKELIKDIFFGLTEILRYTSMVTLSAGLKEIKDMQDEIDTFKAALYSEDINEDQFIEVDITTILEKVFTALDEFSREKQTEIRKINWQNKIIVNGEERELYTALYNVVHNAIKYSWSKPGEKIPYISIEPEIIHDKVQIKVENRGVAVRKEELVGNPPKIFQFSYRGAKSFDRERKGSGVGLWHARKIIRQHKGNIVITSDPINRNITPINYDQPFITTVTIILPLKSYKI